MRIIQLILFFLSLVSCSGCEKDPAAISPRDMLGGKTWFLEQRVVKIGQDSVRHSFLGLPTFWFKLRREDVDSSYIDSDGYVGRYRVEESVDELLLTIIQLNRGTAKSYRVTYVGYDYLVVEFDMNQYVNRLYFSSRL